MTWAPADAAASPDSIAIAATTLAALCVVYNALVWSLPITASPSHRLAIAALNIVGAQFLISVFTTTASLLFEGDSRPTILATWAQPVLCAALCVLLVADRGRMLQALDGRRAQPAR